jgi:hypothetical protein
LESFHVFFGDIAEIYVTSISLSALPVNLVINLPEISQLQEHVK